MTDLGTFKGRNASISDHLNQVRRQNLRDFAWFLVAMNIQAFGWLAWADAFKF